MEGEVTVAAELISVDFPGHGKLALIIKERGVVSESVLCDGWERTNGGVLL